MKQIFLIILSLLLALPVSARRKTNISTYHGTTIECLGVELDGSQTLRVSGIGRNRADAVEQAKKNAVEAVLFQGILDGDKSCDVRPLLNEPNVRDKYEDYFNIFFADGGEYLKYVSQADERKFTRERYDNATQNVKVITVRVLRSELKKRLIADNVLPQ